MFFLDNEMIFVHAQKFFQAYFMIAVGLFFIVYIYSCTGCHGTHFAL